MIREGDVFMFQAENTGPGGLFVHHGRMFSLGRPPQEIVDLFGQLVEAQDYTIKLLQPGVSCAEIFAESLSIQTTSWPKSAKQHPDTNPTYPAPIITIRMTTP